MLPWTRYMYHWAGLLFHWCYSVTELESAYEFFIREKGGGGVCFWKFTPLIFTWLSLPRFWSSAVETHFYFLNTSFRTNNAIRPENFRLEIDAYSLEESIFLYWWILPALSKMHTNRYWWSIEQVISWCEVIHLEICLIFCNYLYLYEELSLH